MKLLTSVASAALLGLAMAAVGSFAGCGQKGPLTLPVAAAAAKRPAAAAPPAAPAASAASAP